MAELRWVNSDGTYWTTDDRFSVAASPKGWYGYDHKTRDDSPCFASPEEAMAWCGERPENPGFDGTYPDAARGVGFVNPNPPGA